MQDNHMTVKARRTANIGLTLLRLTAGGIFVTHGWQKLADVSGTIASFTRVAVPFPQASAYLAMAGELLGGLGLVLGIVTPWAASALVVTTLGAIYFLHGESGFYAASSGWEYPLALLAVCTYFVTNGPGPHSIDTAIVRERPRFRRRHRQVAPLN